MLVDAIAPNLSLLILGRLLQGVGTGISLPMMSNLILEQAPPAQLGVLMGIGNFITAIAPAIGPSYGGVLVDTLGWHYIFLMIVPVLLVAFVLGRLTLHQLQPPTRPAFDHLGWLYLSSLLIMLILLVTQLQHLHVFMLGELAIALASSYLLFQHYHRTAHPILQFRLFDYPPFSKRLTSYFLGQFMVLALSFLIPSFVQISLHHSSFRSHDVSRNVNSCSSRAYRWSSL